MALPGFEESGKVGKVVAPFLFYNFSIGLLENMMGGSISATSQIVVENGFPVLGNPLNLVRIQDKSVMKLPY